MKITIDGRPVDFEGRPTILEVAGANGIYVPSLCDHAALEPFAACRLCLVEVKGRRGYVPACYTTADDGMEVLTATPEIQALRRGILELILAEHPNACLICAEKPSCDEYKATIRKTGEVTGCVLCPVNGRCQLQKAVEAVGIKHVPFPSLRRPGEIRRDDPFIDRDNSLCILCGRCVRVCQEVRGASVLTFVSRGSDTVIGTAIERRLLDSGCRFCGACVDVCPTGSLAERAARYGRRPDEEKPALCPLCAQGCRLRLELRGGRILWTGPDPEGPVNSGQACVKGRFLVKAAVYDERRRLRPMVRKDGRLQESTWEEALDTAAKRLSALGAGEIAVAGSAQSSCEDLFALHRFAASVLKAAGVSGPWAESPAARLRGLGESAGQDAALNFRIADIGRAGVILQFGEDLPETQPILGLAVYRAVRDGASLVRVGAGAVRPGGWAAITARVLSGKEGAFLDALTAVILKSPAMKAARLAGIGGFRAAFKDFDPTLALRGIGVSENELLEVAHLLMTRRPSYFFFGPEFLRTSGWREDLASLWNLAALAGARMIPLGTEANLRGALEIARAFSSEGSAVPKTAKAGSSRVRALYLAGPGPSPARTGMDLVIVQGPYDDENTEIADIVLPETTSFESDGIFVNAEGRAQLTGAGIAPAGEARPGWLILRDLAGRMGASEFGNASVDEIRKNLAAAVRAFGDIAALPGRPEGVFVKDGPPVRAALIRAEAASGGNAERLASAPVGPDEYRGLRLARENKSLRLVRGR
ncbi:MAG TPA: molybdopterin-dependent oxidoreductase [Terriglobales bacterium]|nr:molybdopterin-dependent oxidoreductase [Terriglobales bacterium]